jgi:hypothetical protein
VYKIPEEFIPNWSRSGSDRFPASVDIICPFCGRQVNFALTGWEQSKSLNGRLGRSRCPGCGKSALFLCVNYPPDEDTEVYIYPAPKLIRKPVEGIESTDKFPDPLKGAYASAINTFNVRQWTAAAVLCGRVLEGLAKSLMPEDKQNLPLARQLRELPNQVDLEAPILMLADGIRKGRNIGAHFDAEKEPDQETTEMMLDLLDYIIEYLFVLPGRIEGLHNKLAASE